MVLRAVPVAGHGRGAAPPIAGAAPTTGLALNAALRLVIDTPYTRQGLWYGNFAQLERTYGVTSVHTISDTQIDRYVATLGALRPGPESGVGALVNGYWHQKYGYDLFDIATELHTRDDVAGDHLLALVVGQLDTRAIAYQLSSLGYKVSTVGGARVYVYSAVPPADTAGSALNAVVLGPQRLVSGAWPVDVAAAARAVQQGRGTLGQDRAYRDLAAALGPVQGAYLAQTAPPTPFDPPPGGHTGPPLHPFVLYGVAVQEPQSGGAILELALTYRGAAEARADAPTLRARWLRERLTVLGRPWRALGDRLAVGVRGRTLLLRMRLNATVAPALWQDLITTDDLSLLSR